MRGRARLVFSAVTVGGICAAFVAPSASWAMPRIRHNGPVSSKGHNRLTRVFRPAAGGGPVFRATGSDGLPHMTLIDFMAPATLPALTAPVTAAPVTAAPVAVVVPTASQPSVALAAPHRTRLVRAASAAAVGASGASPGGAFACIRSRESGGNYATNTGNGYYGAYQFKLSTWRSLGGTGLPSQAPPGVQDAMAQRLQQRSGWGQWSTASRCGV
jgi:Transglycosylase-like domain